MHKSRSLFLKTFCKDKQTRGGNIFSAARRGTENPPCVLVSLAVRVLQKNSAGCLFCLRPISDKSKASWSYCRTKKQNFVSCFFLRDKVKSTLTTRITGEIVNNIMHLLYLQVEESSEHRPHQFQCRPNKNVTSITY